MVVTRTADGAVIVRRGNWLTWVYAGLMAACAFVVAHGVGTTRAYAAAAGATLVGAAGVFAFVPMKRVTCDRTGARVEWQTTAGLSRQRFHPAKEIRSVRYWSDNRFPTDDSNPHSTETRWMIDLKTESQGTVTLLSKRWEALPAGLARAMAEAMGVGYEEHHYDAIVG